MGDAAGEPSDRLESLRLPQLLLEPLALADVAADRFGADRLAVLEDQPARDLHLDVRTVSRQQLVLVDGVHGAGELLRACLVEGLARLHRNQVLETQFEQLLAAVAGRAEESLVHVGHAAVQIHGRDQVARVLEQVAVASFAAA